MLTPFNAHFLVFFKSNAHFSFLDIEFDHLLINKREKKQEERVKNCPKITQFQEMAQI